jgi:hypothetical protein
MFGATWWAVQLFVGGWVDGTLEEIIKGVVQINQLCCGRGGFAFFFGTCDRCGNVGGVPTAY